MLTRIAAFMTAAALLLCAIPRSVRAAAPAAAAPITIQGCSVDGKWQTYDVNFTNVTSQPITKVHFALTDASGVLAMVDDVGTYAPGDAVHHRLRVPQLLLQIYDGFTCVPSTVTFQDGTTWQNPDVAADMEHALPQTSGSQIAVSKCFIGYGLEMAWKNTAQQSATEVDVGLMQHGVMVYEYNDKGTFSPGTLIDREYGYDNISNGGKGYVVGDDMMQNRCIILGVHYADGTAWSNPSTPALSEKGVPFTLADPDPAAPVAVTNCDGKDGSWWVNYTNASSKQIVAADFAFIMRGFIKAAARDLHTLSAGAGNHVSFPLGDPDVYHSACIPLRVNFTDGTVWMNPLFAPKSTEN